MVVAQKMVAYHLAVDREEREFIPGVRVEDINDRLAQRYSQLLITRR
jgi:hypothetical protein